MYGMRFLMEQDCSCTVISSPSIVQERDIGILPIELEQNHYVYFLVSLDISVSALAIPTYMHLQHKKQSLEIHASKSLLKH